MRFGQILPIAKAAAIARIAQEHLANQISADVLECHANYILLKWRPPLTPVSEILRTSFTTSRPVPSRVGGLHQAEVAGIAFRTGSRRKNKPSLRLSAIRSALPCSCA